MVLLQRSETNWFRVIVELYFRLQREDPELPEAVRVPIKFGDWERITIGQVVEKARVKLREWYPERYGNTEVAEAGFSADGS